MRFGVTGFRPEHLAEQLMSLHYEMGGMENVHRKSPKIIESHHTHFLKKFTHLQVLVLRSCLQTFTLFAKRYENFSNANLLTNKQNVR